MNTSDDPYGGVAGGNVTNCGIMEPVYPLDGFSSLSIDSNQEKTGSAI